MLPQFPQSPQTLTVRQLECICCREVFTIAEDIPNRQAIRSSEWRTPRDQYPMTTLRFDKNRGQIGVIPAIRTQPTQPIQADQDWSQNYHLNCPRCGADNRNALLISSQIRPFRAFPIIWGGIIVSLLVIYIFASQSLPLFPERPLAILCFVLAAFLPLLIVPYQWRALRNHKLARQFLSMVSQQKISPTVKTVLMLHIILIWAIPGARYGVMPTVRHTASIIMDTLTGQEIKNTENAQAEITEDLEFLAEWFYLGSLTSLISSIFAILGVNAVLAGANIHLPRPIYANTANMVRVTLGETRRTLEINQFFNRIQWTLTRRNEAGGINMEGYFRDPPEFLPNGQLDEEVRVQKYTIRTDRWCVITNAEITNSKEPRPAGGVAYVPPVVNSSAAPAIIGRQRY